MYQLCEMLCVLRMNDPDPEPGVVEKEINQRR
jgi:hypothetical protein